MAKSPITLSKTDACIDAIIARVGQDITLGLPLGLGKPVRIINALYRRAQQDPGLNLHIVTALSPLAPQGKGSLERRFMEPFAERVFGDVPELNYARDAVNGKLPPNVKVSEFFFQAGAYLNNPLQQQHYVCTNYTHAVRDLMALGVNVVAQMVAPDPSGSGETFSLSCNPDLSLDLVPKLQALEASGVPVALVGELNRQLPYMGNDAVVPATAFDILLQSPADDYPLFPVPSQPISAADHLIGFYASTLIRDGGTLQVGIGSLGAAVVNCTLLRHRANRQYKAVFDHLQVAERFPVVTEWGGTEAFSEGLYGSSEMMVDGFIHLLNGGVLKRQVFSDVDLQELINAGLIGSDVSIETLDVLREQELIDSPLRARDIQWLKQYGILRSDVQFKGGRLTINDYSLDPDLDKEDARCAISTVALGKQLTGGVVLHGGFYIGPDSFYEQLRNLPQEDAARICMTSVNFINDLYDHRFGNQRLKAAQRKESRFINSAMMCTLDGSIVSDGLDDGRVVSGVGGQYNFVAMAHELPRARSIIALRSTRKSGKAAESNIIFSYGHCTIPRHLRDVVITEYGIADLRGKSDQEVYLALIRIADARFQPGLLKQAQKAGKVAASFRLPAQWQQNTPDTVRTALASAGTADAFASFPFGCDFTDDELVLAKALKGLKAATSTWQGKLATVWKALREAPADDDQTALLERMSLADPEGLREKLDQRLLVHALRGSRT